MWYDDFELSVTDSRVENLIGDTGFEGSLGVDHWYFREQGEDWDSFQVWQEGSTLEAVDGGIVGNKAVKFSGTSTFVSKTFSYQGEELLLGGWIRTCNVQRGIHGWCGACVQLVGFDEKGQHVCHNDLTILDGDTPWTYYSCPVRFTGAVKKVQVWIRIFEGARGSAWFDEIHLGRIPLAGQRRPFDAAKASISIDVSKPTSVINHKV